MSCLRHEVVTHFSVSIHHLLPVGIGNTFSLVCFAIEIDHNSVTQRLDFVCLDITQALLHLEAGVAQFGDTALAHNVVMEMHGMTEIKVDVDEDIFECKPIDWRLEDMLEIAASTHVEEVALRPVVDVIIRVEVAHADLDGTGEHISYDLKAQMYELLVEIQGYLVLQKLGEKRSRMVKISKRPTNMSKESSHLAKSGMLSKVPLGPVIPDPGP